MKKELLNAVVISNKLTRYAKMEFGTIEFKLFLYLISKILPEDCFFREVKISIRDFCKIFDITSYELVINACEKLKNNVITLNGEILFVLEYCDIDDRIIKTKLNDDLSYYLLGQKSEMTIFDLGYIAKLKSKYAIRLYLYACGFKSQHLYNVSEKNFNLIISAYKTRSETMRRIVNPAIKEIMEKTNIVLFCKYLDKQKRYCFFASEKLKEERTKVDEWRIEAQKELVDYNVLESILFVKEIEKYF